MDYIMDYSSSLGAPDYKFWPTEDELVRLYLRRKAIGLPLPTADLIFDFDLYGENDPSEIWDNFMGPHPSLNDFAGGLYLFTKLKWLSPSAVDRRIISGGTWRKESCITICASRSVIPIAMLKCFRYRNPDSPQDGAWFMEEYSLPMSKTRPRVGFSSSSSYVLCRLSKNISVGLEFAQFFPINETDEDEKSLPLHLEYNTHCSCGRQRRRGD